MDDATWTGRRSLEERIIERAQGDPAFRADLLRDPRRAIQQELGTSLPDGLDIRVAEETPNRVYLVVPPDNSQD